MSGLSPPGPLAYEGQVVVGYINRPFAPSSSFTSFQIGTLWLDTATSQAYILVSLASNVATWKLISADNLAIDTITTPDSTVVIPTNGNVNFLNGTGVNITGSGSSITFNATGRGMSWSTITTSTQAIVLDNGYFANNGGGVTFTLPASANLGQTFSVVSINAGGWTIAQRAGQAIRFGSQITTTGTGGSLASTAIGDVVTVICDVANTSFIVLDAIGDLVVT